MKAHWVKRGLLYSLPEGGLHPKLRSHTANPTPVHMRGDMYRIFYSARDASNRSSIGAADIDIITGRVVREHTEPFLQHGPAGSFFQDGISLGNYYETAEKRYIPFMGWQNPPDGHWRGDIGRIILKDTSCLEVESLSPFMGPDEADPVSYSYPWIMATGSSHYDMWYGSTVAWDAGNGDMLHVLKHAESADGEIFQKTSLMVPCEMGVAQAFSRPTVLRLSNDEWHMWFSYRGGSGERYRIGHASSEDGKSWRLSLDSQTLEPSGQGWDSHMVEYPYVFIHKGEIIMLYNGNGYGQSGFGMAVLEFLD